MSAASLSKDRIPWVLVSGGFREQAGQDKPNAAVADCLLARGTPVHLVGHHIATRFRQAAGCVVHEVARPMKSDLLGVFKLRRQGRIVARQVTAACPGARVVVNGGCCPWDDVNWVHFVHSAWRPAPRKMPVASRLKQAVAGAIFRRHERDALTAARLVLADSERTRRAAIDCFGLDPLKVRTVYYGSDSTWAAPDAAERQAARMWLGVPADKPLAVFVGGFGFDERKGFDLLFRGFRELCQDASWDVDLVAAGGGRTLTYWQRLISQAGLASRIRTIGFTDRVYDVLAAADLLVSPVRYEPYGLNVQEAICRGVPALVSSRAGVVEQYPQDLSEMIIPDPEDVDDIVRRLRAWRSDVAGWRAKFAPAAAAIRRRSWRDMAEEVVALVESVPAVGRGSRS